MDSPPPTTSFPTTFTFPAPNPHHTLTLQITHLASFDYSVVFWPSSERLARTLWSMPQLTHNLRVVELGAGTCLPGMVAVACGAREVILTDHHDAHEARANIQHVLELNTTQLLASRALDTASNTYDNDADFKPTGVAAPTADTLRCRFLPLTWGVFDVPTIELAESKIDVVIGADCFYNTADFEDIMGTLSLFAAYNPELVVVLTIHCRSSNHTIEHLLPQAGFEVLCVANGVQQATTEIEEVSTIGKDLHTVVLVPSQSLRGKLSPRLQSIVDALR